MKLEFSKESISLSLADEIGLQDYLDLFSNNLQIIKSRVIKPLSKEQCHRQFKELNRLRESKQSWQKLIDLSSKLPNLQELLSIFERGELLSYHLYLLGTFLEINTEISNCELVKDSSSIVAQLKTVLSKYTIDKYSSLKVDSETILLEEEIKELNKIKTEKIINLEKQILDESGLKMIFPYPKELSIDSTQIAKIKNCDLLTTTVKGKIVSIEFNISTKLDSTIKDINKLNQKFTEKIDHLLRECNSKLQPLFIEFQHYYSYRRERSYYYSILNVLEQNNLTIPDLTSTNQITIRNGKLPKLKESKKDQYSPLTVTINGGATLLFGGNMTGKTTILKTLYFHLLLVHLGLPVPAKQLALKFPEYIKIYLKNSGDINSGLSSFGEELDFLTTDHGKYGITLVDELLNSTNYTAGTELSKIFLKEYAKREDIFFASSFYSELIELNDIDIFKMKELTINQDGKALPQLLTNYTFELEKIEDRSKAASYQEDKKQMALALSFPISKQIREQIYLALDKGEK